MIIYFATFCFFIIYHGFSHRRVAIYMPPENGQLWGFFKKILPESSPNQAQDN